MLLREFVQHQLQTGLCESGDRLFIWWRSTEPPRDLPLARRLLFSLSYIPIPCALSVAYFDWYTARESNPARAACKTAACPVGLRCILVLDPGLEPGTFCFRGSCPTIRRVQTGSGGSIRTNVARLQRPAGYHYPTPEYGVVDRRPSSGPPSNWLMRLESNQPCRD